MQVSHTKIVIIFAIAATCVMFNMLPSLHHFIRQPIDEAAQYNLSGQVELTIRMPAAKNMVTRFICDLMRSAALFWNPKYGHIHVILDGKDGSNAKFTKMLTELDLPFNFRFSYEPEPKSVTRFENVASLVNRRYGYIIQLYSSFLMDLYTNAEIIAWTDTDTVFTQPVLDDHIMRNGKLVAKGMTETFSTLPWLSQWDITTFRSLHLPMASDFMSYFPVFVYARTIKNCRELIMAKLGVTRFEDAFVDITKDLLISPVSVIMSYAYYYERDLYEWHIDVGNYTLEEYNLMRLPRHPLQLEDIQPELHLTVHSGYYLDEYEPLERAICFIQLQMGMETAKMCQHYVGKINYQLFEFSSDPEQNHLNTWCAGEDGRIKCNELISQAYLKISELYYNKTLSFDTSLIHSVEDRYSKTYNLTCASLSYKKFT